MKRIRKLVRELNHSQLYEYRVCIDTDGELFILKGYQQCDISFCEYRTFQKEDLINWLKSAIVDTHFEKD